MLAKSVITPSQEPQKSGNIRQSNKSIMTSGMTYKPSIAYKYFHVCFNSRANDGHSTDSSISERLYGVGSEDELSNGSGNVSPRSRRANKHLGKPTSLSIKYLNVFIVMSSVGSVSNSNSRNQSPRSVNGEAKLRPGVTSRSSNRNSANLSSSAFQEELIRLINPDNIEAGAEPKLCKEQRNHSRENLNNNTLSVHKVNSVFHASKIVNGCICF